MSDRARLGAPRSGLSCPPSEGSALNRRLSWPGCANARDLGGLPLVGGGSTRRSAVVRADALDRLTAEGWAAAWSYGIRTVVDLREPEERAHDAAVRPPVVTVTAPLDGWSADPAFWARWRSTPAFGTPLYYAAFLSRFPDRVAAVMRAIARAEGGGVVFHCGAGRDRAGLVAALVLRVAGVAAEVAADDYALSPQEPELVAYLAGAGLTPRSAMLAVLADLDAPRYLSDAGLVAAELAALRRRLAPG